MLGGGSCGAMHWRGLISVWPAGHAVSPGAIGVPRPPPRFPGAGCCAELAAVGAARIIDAAMPNVKLLPMALPRERGSLNLAREGTEREWLARLRTGDERAFEQLFHAYAAPLCDFAFSYVRVREAAEEIVQDRFCWIWEQRFRLEMSHGIRSEER